jgi:hypothetical protein
MKVRDIPLMALSERQENRPGGPEATAAPPGARDDRVNGKWPADPILGEAMARIRGLAEDELARGGDSKAATYYDVLATRLENEVARVMLHSRLAPGADAAWKAVLAELIQGIDALAGKGPPTERQAGLRHVLRGVEVYEAFFEHPGRRPDDPEGPRQPERDRV